MGCSWIKGSKEDVTDFVPIDIDGMSTPQRKKTQRPEIDPNFSTPPKSDTILMSPDYAPKKLKSPSD